MAEVDIIAGALRMAESGDDYRYQQLASVGGESFRKVGAYGIIEKRWAELADAAGYAGADWRDPTIQDRIAKEKLTRDFELYGSWEAAVVAFRFGGQAAKAHVENIDYGDKAEVNSYVQSVKLKQNKTDRRVLGQVVVGEKEKSPNLGRAEGIIRDKLVMMRDAQQKSGSAGLEDETDEEAFPIGNEGGETVEEV